MRHLFNYETSHSFKTYKTFKNALSHVTKLVEAVEEVNQFKDHVDVIIAATKDGRFKPVVILSGEHSHLTHYFINKNVAAVVK